MTAPATFHTVAWTPVVNAGLPPQHPKDGTEPVATVGWLPKLGTEYYPYEGKRALAEREREAGPES